MKELAIQRQIIEHFEAIGAAVCKLQAVGRRGWPDILVIYQGEVIFVETKTTDGRVSKIQKHVHSEIRNAGGTVIVAVSLWECLRKLETINGEQ